MLLSNISSNYIENQKLSNLEKAASKTQIKHKTGEKDFSVGTIPPNCINESSNCSLYCSVPNLLGLHLLPHACIQHSCQYRSPFSCFKFSRSRSISNYKSP